MSNETETLTILVTETVEYRHTIELTDDLLDEAAARTGGRTWRDVLDMLQEDTDHEVIANEATHPSNFQAVTERTVGMG